MDTFYQESFWSPCHVIIAANQTSLTVQPHSSFLRTQTTTPQLIGRLREFGFLFPEPQYRVISNQFLDTSTTVHQEDGRRLMEATDLDL